MKIFKTGLLMILIASSLMVLSCGEGHHEEVVAPIQIEMPSHDLQHKIGISGFILGTFILMNGYIVIIASCIVLLVKETTFAKIIDTIRMVSPMLNPSEQQQEKITGYLGLLTNAETRTKVGSMALLAGLVIAYVGAWIAL